MLFACVNQQALVAGQPKMPAAAAAGKKPPSRLPRTDGGQQIHEAVPAAACALHRRSCRCNTATHFAQRPLGGAWRAAVLSFRVEVHSRAHFSRANSILFPAFLF